MFRAGSIGEMLMQFYRLARSHIAAIKTNIMQQDVLSIPPLFFINMTLL
jgi:hypothetical protein